MRNLNTEWGTPRLPFGMVQPVKCVVHNEPRMKNSVLRFGAAAVVGFLTFAGTSALSAQQAAAGAPQQPPPPPPTLGLDQGELAFDTPDFKLRLVKASQTIAALEPKGVATYTPTPTPARGRGRGGAPVDPAAPTPTPPPA